MVLTTTDPSSTVAEIRRFEDMGIAAAWLRSDGAGGDPATIFAAAATSTQRILMGTSIAPIWAKHPIALAAQAQAISLLSQGRFRLGVGTSAWRLMDRIYGVAFNPPLGHLREYVHILKSLLQEGSVDYHGKYFIARTATPLSPLPPKVPVMVSALRGRSFQMAGAEADGAISWVCPHPYLRDVALPALRHAASKANREAPPLIVHAPVCVHESIEEAREGFREELGYYPKTRLYAKMLADAGSPGAQETGWTDEMSDALLVSGDEAQVERKLLDLFSWGASELIVTVVPAGPDRAASVQRTERLLAHVSSS